MAPLNLKPFGDTNTGLLGSLTKSIGTIQAPQPVAKITPTQKSTFFSTGMSLPPRPNMTPAPIGITAKSPNDNISPPKTTIAPKDTKVQDLSNTAGKTTSGGTSSSSFPTINETAMANSTTPTPIPSTQNAQNTPVVNNPLPNNNQSTFQLTKDYDEQKINQPTNYQPNAGLYGQLVTGLANRSNQPSEDYSNIQKSIAQNLEQQKQLQQNFAEQNKNIDTSGVDLSLATGQEGILGRLFAAKQGALTSQGAGLSTQLGAANTQQGLMQQALQQAAGLAAPQYGIQYGTQVGNPTQPNGGLDNNSFGGVAAPANIKAVQDYTTQINTTQKSIDTIDNLANQIVPNMTQEGFNPTSSPIGNQTFSQYFTEKNPAAKAGIVAGLGEIKNQISNVIASATGLTPTGVTAVADQYDLTTLNPQQLHDFLQYIHQYAQSNMAAAQSSIDRISSGGSVISNPQELPDAQENSTGQAILGTGGTLAKGFIGKVLSNIGGAVSGAIGGLATKILL